MKAHRFFLSIYVCLLWIRAEAAPVPFCETYDQCREAFLTAAKAHPTADRSQIEVPTKNDTKECGSDSKLYIDSFYLPATEKAEHLVILSSGVHGVEGFLGSVVQQYFLREVLSKLDRAQTGVLLIHAINPYGMKCGRRVSEHNVDLNRNFDTDKNLFKIKNEGYDKLNGFLNPQTPASRSILSYADFYYSIARLLMKESLATLRQATLGGQYVYPEGLYFGGQDFEPQKELLEPLLLDKAKAYRNVLILDLHTGYGNRGIMHLFPNPYPNAEIKAASEKIFKGFKVENPSGADFYENSGDFSTYVSKLFAKENKLAIPMVLEYGTIDNTGYVGGIESIRRMIAENQLHWKGAKSKSTARQIKREMRELYYPTAKSWRDAVMKVTTDRLGLFFSRMSELSTAK